MVSPHKPSGGTGTVQRRPLPKSGFPIWLETAAGKARKRSSYAAEGSMDSGSAQQIDDDAQQRRSDAMTRNQRAGGKHTGATGGWKASPAALLKAHNSARHDGAVASFATQDKRADVLYASFKRLHELKFRMEAVTSLRGKHIEALTKDWEARGLSASTLQNNLSIFRTFAEWIGKAGMVRGIEHYLASGTTARSSIAREDKSWSGKGVDVTSKIEEVRQKDERVALQLAFGLRAREAMQLRPRLADKGTYLSVTHGTKGGRDRVERVFSLSGRPPPPIAGNT